MESMSTPQSKPGTTNQSEMENSGKSTPKSGSDGQKSDSLQGKVSELMKKIRRQKYNFTARHKSTKEEMMEEIEMWKFEHGRIERELEGTKFSYGLSKQEVGVLKTTLRDTMSAKNDEIARLKRDAKGELKKVADELKDAKRHQGNLLQELDENQKINKDLTRKLSAANLDVVNLNHNVQALQRENKVLQNALDKAIAKIEDQMEAKRAQAIEVEKLKLEQEQAKADKAVALTNATRERAEEEYNRKKELLQIQSQIWIKEKEQAMDQKERAKKKTMEEQNERLVFARNMMQKTIADNGGSFVNFNSTQDVSKQGSKMTVQMRTNLENRCLKCYCRNGRTI